MNSLWLMIQDRQKVYIRENQVMNDYNHRKKGDLTQDSIMTYLFIAIKGKEVMKNQKYLNFPVLKDQITELSIQPI
jgi:hypothetical protein